MRNWFIIMISVFLIFLCFSINAKAVHAIGQPAMVKDMTFDLDQMPEQRYNTLFSLRHYGALAKDDLSICEEDPDCVKRTSLVQEWSCAYDICNDTDSGKNPLDCFNRPPDVARETLTPLLCDFLLNPNAITEKKLSAVCSQENPDDVGGGFIKLAAQVLALRVSGDACVNLLKRYKGSYKQNWKFSWYRTLAGCSILSKKRHYTVQEKNLLRWGRWGYCRDITDPELSAACQAVGGEFVIDPESIQE